MKKLPVEFLSDNKLVFQEYSHLRTITEWDPSIPGLALCPRSEAEVRRWSEECSGQSILLNAPSLLIGERISVYRVEGTTQWYSAFIIAHCQESGEFTVTDDTVLEEHYENPDTVQMRILGEGVIDAILSGEALPVNPRRSRANVYRPLEKPRGRSTKPKSGEVGKVRRSSSASVSGKLQPRNKRRVSSESPKKKQSPPPKRLPTTKSPPPKSSKSKSPSPSKSTTKLKSKSGFLKSPSSSSNTPTNLDTSKPSLVETQPSGVETERRASALEASTLPSASASAESALKESADPPSHKQEEHQKLEELVEEVESPSLPIRLPTKSKSKPADSDSDSDSKSTKSSASSSSKVARSFKKTFKGKAIAIVKPFSNPAPEKKSPESKPVQEPVESSTPSDVTDEYEFGVEEEEESGLALEEGSSRRKEGVKPVKRLKGGRQLKSVRVRVEKLHGKRQGPRVRDVPPGARQGVEVKSDPDEDQELEEGEGLLVKEEEEERTAGGEEGEEGVVTNLKTEEKSEARDLIEERRKTEEGGRDEGEGGEKEDSEEKSEGVKAKPKGLQLDANNDSKPLHSDSVQLVKAEVKTESELPFPTVPGQASGPGQAQYRREGPLQGGLSSREQEE